MTKKEKIFALIAEINDKITSSASEKEIIYYNGQIDALYWSVGLKVKNPMF